MLRPTVKCEFVIWQLINMDAAKAFLVFDHFVVDMIYSPPTTLEASLRPCNSMLSHLLSKRHMNSLFDIQVLCVPCAPS